MSHLRNVDLVFSDISMPGRIDGLEMAKLIATRRPELPVVLTSGYMVAPERLEHAGALFLPKPYTVQKLRTALTSALYRAKPQP